MSNHEPALVFANVSKRYGTRVALNRTSFTVPQGAVVGFIGPNGAGKTTSFSVAGGFVRPDEGSVDVLGKGPFEAKTHKGLISLMPQDSELGHVTPVGPLLVYLARLQGLTAGEAERDKDRVLDQVQLRERERERISQLSHGMKKRVALAQALLGKPLLLLLDEPTSGLDPALIRDMRDLFRAQHDKARGQTTILSSHNLSDIEAVCDEVIFLQAGSVVQSGKLAEVTARGSAMRCVLRRALSETEAEALRALIPALRIADLTLQASSPDNDQADVWAATLLMTLGQRNIPVEEFRRGTSLEDAYLQSGTSVDNSPGAG